jgi:hypothetical protein
MAAVKVHLLNFHTPFNSHIEIVLEILPEKAGESTQWYNINRWAYPLSNWSKSEHTDDIIREASSTYSLMVDANPDEIVQEWEKYWTRTAGSAGILGNNCAVAAQWFLSTFAHIPEPNHSNISLNYLSLGILWPSIIPCPVMLPGRVMSNAKFHIEAQKNAGKSNQHSNAYLYLGMTMSAALIAASALGIYIALNILTAGMATIVTLGCVAAGLGCYGLFNSYNQLSAKKLFSNKQNESAVKNSSLAGCHPCAGRDPFRQPFHVAIKY